MATNETTTHVNRLLNENQFKLDLVNNNNICFRVIRKKYHLIILLLVFFITTLQFADLAIKTATLENENIFNITNIKIRLTNEKEFTKILNNITNNNKNILDRIFNMTITTTTTENPTLIENIINKTTEYHEYP